MRQLWFADPRDLIKWGVLVHLADEKKLKTIVQVPYLPKDEPLPQFSFCNSKESLTIAQEVWGLLRDIKLVEKLGRLGATAKVKVLVTPFDPAKRDAYSDYIVRQLKGCRRPLLLFLDPDTGLEPTKATAKHVTQHDVKRAWQELLHHGDWLVLYQHKWQRRSLKWTVNRALQELKKICGVRHVEAAWSDERGMKDVALLCLGPKP